jgi:catechol 2,3-dioxygenase-like lactoylglutathione lyase family enzyme
MAIKLESTVPILRIFDVAKAREFYIDYLGFKVDFEHRFGENFPLYMGISRDGIQFHLSEHHGDASPGAAVFVRCNGVDELCAELNAKDYRYLKPGVILQEWGTKEMHLSDPFGNKLRIAEYVKVPA